MPSSPLRRMFGGRANDIGFGVMRRHDAAEDLAGRGAGTRQPRCADCVLDAGLVAKSRGHLRAARSAERAPSARRRRTSGGCDRTSTCPASSSATTCWTSPASAAPEYREQLTEFRRTNMATLDELETLIGRDDRIAEPARQAGRILGDVRSAVRLDARPRKSSGAPPSCAVKSCRGAKRCWRSRRRSRS